MSERLQKLWNEPAMLGALVEALIAAAVAFGLDLSGEQVAGVMAIVAVLTGYSVRTQAYGPKTVDQIRDAEKVISAAERG